MLNYSATKNKEIEKSFELWTKKLEKELPDFWTDFLKNEKL